MVNYEKVNEQIYAVTDGSTHGNVGALVLPSKIVVVDTGFNKEPIIEFRKELELLTKKKVEILLLTHYHSDHTRWMPIFADCRIVACKHLLKKVGKRAIPKGYEKTLPNELFDDYLELNEDGIKIILKRTKGHTEDSTYIFCPDYKVLFTGDSFFVNAYPFGGNANVDPLIWVETIKEFLTLDVDYIIPGHGPLGTKNDLEKFLQFLEELNGTFKTQITAGKTQEEVFAAAKKIGQFPRMRAQEITIKRFYKYWIKKLEKY